MMGKLIVMATVGASVAQAQVQERNADLIPTRVEIVVVRATPDSVAVLHDAARRDSLGRDTRGRDVIARDAAAGDSVARKALPGDSVLRLSVDVRNVGLLDVVAATSTRIRFTVDGTMYEAALTRTSGTTNDLPIPPGGLGRMSVEVPLGSLRPCQYVTVQIDTQQQFQRGGPRVVANDSARLPVHQRSAAARCPADGSRPRG